MSAGGQLRRVARRVGGSRSRSDMARDVEETARLVAEMNHIVVHLATTVAQQSARIDELHHLVQHLDRRFEQTRDHVEILSALTLVLQRDAERQGRLPEGSRPTA